MLAVAGSGDAAGQSLVTWLTWLGANGTMALWLYEQGGRQVSKAIGVNLCNAVMCAATATLILVQKL